MVTFRSILAATLCFTAPPAGASTDPDDPRPIDARDTVNIEEMTWMEVRDAMRAGMDTVIVATGGVEQNGPYLPAGKHNYILQATTESIARTLGNALVAPIVGFVPEGDIDPPTGHMAYSSTVSISEETFRRLLIDICASYHSHGFAHIVLIGDSGGNQSGMELVAEELNARWSDGSTKVHFIPEYYNWGDVNAWLETQGIHQEPEGIHDDFAISASLAVVDPRHLRMEERITKDLFRINGVELAPIERTIEWGRRIVAYRTEATVTAIRRRIGPSAR